MERQHTGIAMSLWYKLLCSRSPFFNIPLPCILVFGLIYDTFVFTGCGPFPIGSKWRMQNGSEAGNESLVGETYFSECSPGHKWSVVMYCGPDSKWNTNYSTPCESDQCGNMQMKKMK